MKLGSNPDVALTEVLSKVQSVRGQLPEEAEDPTIVKGTGMQFALMYLAALNPNMTQEQMTEYLERVIRPRMSTIEGVAEIQIIGAANYAMRVWIDPLQLAARGVTAADVLTAIRSLELPRGAGQAPRTSSSPTTSRCRRRCRRRRRSARCRCSARATRSCACATWRGSSSPPRSPRRSSPSTASPAPSSASSRRRRRTRSTPPPRWWTSCRRSTPACPQGMKIELVYDSTETISALDPARCSRPSPRRSPIVVVVILLFLGSFRSVLMPVVTIPLSLIGVCSILLVARLLAQPALAPRHGAGHRPRRRRRHRGGREHPPPHRGGADAARRLDHRHEGDHRPGDRHDADARRRALAARLHRRADRRALPRVRLHPGRRGRSSRASSR